MKDEVSAPPSGLSKIVTDARQALKLGAIITPVNQLNVETSTEIGRNLPSMLERAKGDHAPIGVRVRNRVEGVIMSIDQYQSLIDLKHSAEQLIEAGVDATLEQGANEFDALLADIQSAPSVAAAQSVFQMGGDELGSFYSPGLTETPPE